MGAQMPETDLNAIIERFVGKVQAMPGVLGVVPDRRQNHVMFYTLLNTDKPEDVTAIANIEEETCAANRDAELGFEHHNLAGTGLSEEDIEDAVGVLRGELAIDRGEFITREQWLASAGGA
jgi:hypothetical protein